MSLILPDNQRLIGVALVALAAAIFVFSIRITDSHFRIGRPNPIRSWFGYFRRHIPLHIASRLTYEAMERSGFDDLTGQSYSSPEVMLSHMKYVLLQAAKKDQVTLYGARPPSTQTLAIPKDLMADLQPEDGTSNLRSLSRARPIDFRDVWISGKDLRRAINERLALLRRADHGFRES